MTRFCIAFLAAFWAGALTQGAPALGAPAPAAPPPPPAGYVPPDPQNTLVIDTTKGRIVIAMRPELAPLSVARVKLLAREHVYDGLLFHRVLPHFVDQTGNPNNHDGGVSAHPNLPPEFFADIAPSGFTPVGTSADGVQGFIGPSPVVSLPRGSGYRVWGAYCDGVAGMGREAAVDTANSEIFFMRAPARYLDHDYAVWGRAIAGLDVIRAMAVGEPPAHPDRMLHVQVMADMPPAARPRVFVEDTATPEFRARVAALRRARGASFSLCDVRVGSSP